MTTKVSTHRSEEVPMTQLDQAPQPTTADDAPADLERRSHAWLWIVLGSVLVIGVAFVATSMLGKSVVYYKTPTEVKSMQGQHVRLAGTLVKDSVQTSSGTTRFVLTDGAAQVPVVYEGSATTALSTASQPGTQMVAEGALGTDGLFHSTVLLAKCPSKFQSGGATDGQ